MKFKMLLALPVALLSANAAQADVVFQIDLNTGEVILINDGASTLIAGYDLNVLNGVGTFNTAAFNDAATAGSNLTTSTKVSEIGLLGDFTLNSGSTSLGTGLFVPNLGPISQSDFSTQVTTTSGDITSSVSLVPEPGSLALLGLGGLALMARRRRSA